MAKQDHYEHRNGVVVPRQGTKAAAAWALFDELLELGDLLHRDAIEAGLARLEGAKPAVISTWFGNWKRSKANAAQ